ncbi:hypothetical protein [Bacillus sp. FJAT-52991]|uniref:DUF304 domain-containing protein n=1 Tax=Bacillus kandeliae TaxID=3129297 RepID=A0ABZ2N6R5_9BACI
MNSLQIKMLILATLPVGFLIYLFIKYKQGKMEINPYVTIIKKEMSVSFHTFFKWRKKHHQEEMSAFFYHKKSNYFWMFLALLHEQILEMAFFHIYLKEEAPILASVMLVLHIYSVFYIIGEYNLIRNSPILISQDKVSMKIGVRRDLTFHMKDIGYIQAAEIKYDSKGSMIHEKGVFHATAFPRTLTRIFGISDEANYDIFFNKPLQARGYFGQFQEVHKARVYLDQPAEFLETLQQKLEDYHSQPETEEVIVPKEPPLLLKIADS